MPETDSAGHATHAGHVRGVVVHSKESACVGGSATKARYQAR
ncbi:MAG TPA: hypothetical protein VMU92_00410 [Acidobacteriaceae bacterium]|nr:hypothetical protein [Acidobacteriaceae bacterium]